MIFQFHKGTIRTVISTLQNDRLNPFQFHKGTIRTHIDVQIDALVSVFQFHKGTIRTIKIIKDILDDANFNSIKVRLEL